MLLYSPGGQRLLVDGARGGDVAAAETRSLGNLGVAVHPVPGPDRVDAIIGAAEPAGQVVTEAYLGLLRWLGAEVRIERDEPLDLVQRTAHIARQRDQLLAGQPAGPFLDGVQRRDQAGPGELARPGLDAGDAGLGLSHRRGRSGRHRT